MYKSIGGAACLAAMLFALAGCVTPSPEFQEPSSGPVAEVTFVGAADYYPIMSKDGDCMKYDTGWYPRIAKRGSLDAVIKVAANSPLRMSYQHRDREDQLYCDVAFSFVPEEGKSYVVLNEFSANKDAGFFDRLFQSNLGHCRVGVVEKAGNSYVPVKGRKLEVGARCLTSLP